MSTYSKIKSFDPSSVVVKPSGLEVKKPKTGPGAFGDFMERESVVYSENERLKNELDIFEKSDAVLRIDPLKIRPSRFANRLEINFQSKDFDDLKQGIFESNGNVQPIKVRHVPGASADEFEIVFGHRRHRACLELGIPVLAVISKLMSDKQLFCEMERENQFRKNISPFEQGLFYKNVLDAGIYESASALAIEAKVANSAISRALKLVNLPRDVLDSFLDPTEIQYRWIDSLSKALIKNEKKVLSEARKIKAEIIKPSAKEVVDKLIHAAQTTTKKRPEKDFSMSVKMLNGNRSARISLDYLPGDESKREAFIVKVKEFIKNYQLTES